MNEKYVWNDWCDKILEWSVSGYDAEAMLNYGEQG